MARNRFSSPDDEATMAEETPTIETSAPSSSASANTARRYVSREEALAWWTPGREPTMEVPAIMEEHSEGEGASKRYYIPQPVQS